MAQFSGRGQVCSQTTGEAERWLESLQRHQGQAGVIVQNKMQVRSEQVGPDQKVPNELWNGVEQVSERVEFESCCAFRSAAVC